MPTNPNAKLFNEWGAFAVIPHEFIDASTAYSDQAFRLFVLLMRYTNGKTGEAFPSYTHLQSLTGWSTKTIAKAIRELEAAGWIVRKKQFSGPTHYTLVRPHSFPSERTDSTSLGKGMRFPTERTALSQGKPKKNEIKYIESKKIEREEAAHSRLPALDQPKLIHVEPNAVSVLLEVFPQTPIYSQEVIDAADIRDLKLWRQVLSDWRDNRYSTRNMTGMRDRYRSQLAKQEEQANGQNRTRQNNGRPTQLDAARAYNARMQAALERRAARSAGAGDSENANGEQPAALVRR
jgi:hypothetical protein